MPFRDYETLQLDATGLVPIAVQRGFDHDRWGERNNPDAERHVAALLSSWRDAGLPVIHVRHDSTEEVSPLRPDRSGNAFKPAAEPAGDEPVVPTDDGAAFLGTDLAERLRDRGVGRPIFVGFTTDRRVSTATRVAGHLGFAPYVVADATVTFERSFDGTRYAAEQNHRLALAHLSAEFGTVVETATVLAALESRG